MAASSGADSGREVVAPRVPDQIEQARPESPLPVGRTKYPFVATINGVARVVWDGWVEPVEDWRDAYRRF